ncbi:hypothetical protein BY458DRAFT_499080 [Sporodiniella umbellata]|nr:hypothetical protein BY458DRAFT_499080 [Sporodiniella umbellata]
MQARVQRALEQKMFVLSRETDGSIERFEVVGSIGNNYTVTIGGRMKCTCVDHSLRRNFCKHILMVLLRVYRLPYQSAMFQKLSTKKEDRLNARSLCQPVDPSILVPDETKERILKIMRGDTPEFSTQTERRPLATSDCPVCFEPFEQAEIDTIDYCQLCGNNIHQACFAMWASTKGNPPTCVYCRSEWVTKESLKKKKVQLDSAHNIEYNYPNFAQELGLSTKRDTSTYQSTGSYSRRPYWDDDA